MNTSRDSYFDHFHSAKQENLELKKRLNEQQETSKRIRLQTRMIKLEQELKKSRTTQGIPLKETSSLLKQSKMLNELEDQVHTLNKSNSTLKQRLMQYQALLDVPSKKQIRRSNAPVKRHPPQQQFNISTHMEPSESSSQVEEVERLHELIEFLRTKLSGVEEERVMLESELKQLREGKIAELEKMLLQADAERIALQRQINDFGSQQESSKLQIENEQLKHNIELLNQELQELSEKMNTTASGKNIKRILEDVQKEKEFISNEYSRLLALSKSNPEVAQREREIETLKRKLQTLQESYEQRESGQSNLLGKVKSLQEQLGVYEKRHLEYAEMKQKYDDIMRKLDLIDGEFNIDEFDEAIAFIRLRRDRGLGPALGIIRSIDEMHKDRKLYDQLRVDYLRCVEDLEQTKQLLKNQDKILQKTQEEKAQLTTEFEQTKREYEVKINDLQRLLDSKLHRLARLEAQLSEIANGPGTASTKLLSSATANPEDMALLQSLMPGENFLEIRINEAKLNANAILPVIRRANTLFFNGGAKMEANLMKQSKSCDILDPAKNLLTFVSFDFYDFATQVSRMVSGIEPQYAFTFRFRVFINDIFIQYISSHFVALELWRHLAGEPIKLGQCRIGFKDLLDDKDCQWINYVADLHSIEDSTISLGHISYSIRFRIPLEYSLQTQRTKDDITKVLLEHEHVENLVIKDVVAEKVEETVRKEKNEQMEEEMEEEMAFKEREIEKEVREMEEFVVHDEAINDKNDEGKQMEILIDKQSNKNEIKEEERNEINEEDELVEIVVSEALDEAVKMTERIASIDMNELKPEISIEIIKWKIPDQNLANKLFKNLNLNQLFAAFEFMDFPLDELESPSMQFDGNQLQIEFNFKKIFDFSQLEAGIKFQKFLQSQQPIKFVLVCEPKDETGAECVDFAETTINLQRLSSNAGDSVTMDLPLIGIDDFDAQEVSSRVGSLQVCISGLKFIQEVCELFDVPVQKPQQPRKESPPKVNKPQLSSMGNISNNSQMGSNRNISVRNLNSTIPISGSFAKLNVSSIAVPSGNTSNSVKGSNMNLMFNAGSSVRLDQSATVTQSLSEKKLTRQASQDSIEDLVGQVFDDSSRMSAK